MIFSQLMDLLAQWVQFGPIPALPTTQSPYQLEEMFILELELQNKKIF